MLEAVMEILKVLSLVIFAVRSSTNVSSCLSYREGGLDNLICSSRKLWRYENVSRLVHCSSYCDKDANCVSFFYHKALRTCQGHAEIFTSPNMTVGCEGEPGSKHYRTGKADGFVGDRCTTASNCSVANSICVNGVCQCNGGYSLSAAMRSCQLGCTKYGDSFSVMSGYYVSGCNDARLDNITSVTDCKIACLNMTSVLCLTFDHYPGGKYCYLQSCSRYTNPSNWSYYSGIDNYQRDCTFY